MRSEITALSVTIHLKPIVRTSRLIRIDSVCGHFWVLMDLAKVSRAFASNLWPWPSYDSPYFVGRAFETPLNITLTLLVGAVVASLTRCRFELYRSRDCVAGTQPASVGALSKETDHDRAIVSDVLQKGWPFSL